jgi:hypothetical protein
MLKTLNLNSDKFSTLPSRLKHKLPIKKHQTQPKSKTNVDNEKHKKNTCIDTAIQEILHSLNYLTKVIKNEKYEILQNGLTYLLEVVLQFYNCLNTCFGDAIKFDINSSLAKLLKLFNFNYLHMITAKNIDQSMSFNKKTEALDLIKILIFLFENLLVGNSVMTTETIPTSFKRSLSDSNVLDDNRNRYLDLINLKRLFNNGGTNRQRKTSLNTTSNSIETDDSKCSFALAPRRQLINENLLYKNKMVLDTQVRSNA